MRKHTSTTISRREQLHQQQARQAAQETTRRRWFRVTAAVLTALIVAVVGFGLWSAQPVVGGPSRQAPAFSLPTTTGTTVSLADYRGKPVILYFNEGAGCGSCTQQMAMITRRIRGSPRPVSRCSRSS